MKAYRVEDWKNRLGIWRDFAGNISPVFEKLSDGLARNLQMPDEDYYRFGGEQWFAATDTPEKLRAWFSAQDIHELLGMGYEVIEFCIEKCRIKSEYEIVFRREDVTCQSIVEPGTIWPEVLSMVKGGIQYER